MCSFFNMAYMLRWGICGAGKISNDFCGAMTTLPKGEHKIVAVAARSRDRAQEFADRFKATDANVYGSYEELSKDPNVDVVYIGTLHINHAALSIMMMNSGKHVLCEKPMTMNLKQAKKVLECAKEKSLFFMEGIWSRTFPNYERIRMELENGSIGEVELVTAKFCFPAKGFMSYVTRKDGAGYLLAFGFYTIQFATMVFDEMPEKIVAEGVLNDEGTDEQVSAILRYNNGKMASIVFSGKTCFSKISASIHGTKGNIEVPDFFWCPPEIHTPSGVYKNDLPECDVPYNFFNSGGLRYEADYTRKCIQEGKRECPIASHRHSEIIMTIMDEIRRQIGVVYDADLPSE